MEQDPECRNPVKPPKPQKEAPREVESREEENNIKGASRLRFSFEANWEATTPPLSRGASPTVPASPTNPRSFPRIATPIWWGLGAYWEL